MKESILDVLLYLFDHLGEPCSRYAQRVERECRSIRRGAGSVSQRGGSALLWHSSAEPDLLRRGEALLRALGWRGQGQRRHAGMTAEMLRYQRTTSPSTA